MLSAQRAAYRRIKKQQYSKEERGGVLYRKRTVPYDLENANE